MNKTSLIKNKDLRLSYTQQCIDGLLCKVYHFKVNFNPEYQREFISVIVVN